MEMKKSEQTRMNRFAMIGWSITVAIIEAAYLLEVIKGERTIFYYLLMLLMGVIPLVFGWMLYRKDSEIKKLRYFIVYAYSVLYAFVLLTGDTILTFIYIIPVMSVVLVYSDSKLLRNFSIIGVVTNVISVGINVVMRQRVNADNIADYEIQVLGVLLIMVLAFFACRLQGDINEERLGTIAKQTARQEEVLGHVLHATEILNERVSHIDEKAKGIEHQSESAQVSIEEIASGTADVANNIQEQLSMSNGISEELEGLTNISRSIQDKFNETHQLSQEGIQNVDTLSQSAQMVAESKEQVSEATVSLVDSLREAKEILTLIRSITDQTNLLALNASIEAARAGEQGKGFAVVAGEIQKLSGDTGDATDKINDILEVLGTEARRVNRAVENLDEVSSRQNELIQKTDEQFRIIDQNIADMTDEVQKQNDYLTQINDNNVKIAGSISNTSAYTQELTASSENTMNLTKESLEGTRAMAEFLGEILGEVQNLQAITETK
ncbi:MAG: methyl-accepting chemotaxis protein [Lachnospiraceae bacterium]|nr:methyl-accepting chemotaxis protein [Lachnospiraceae bacterium]